MVLFSACFRRGRKAKKTENLGDHATAYRWAVDHYFGNNGKQKDVVYAESVLVRLADLRYEPAEIFLAQTYAGAENSNYEKLEGRWQRYCEISIKNNDLESAFDMAFIVALSPSIRLDEKKKAWNTCLFLANRDVEKALVFVVGILSSEELIKHYGYEDIASTDLEKATRLANRLVKINPGEGYYSLGSISVQKRRFSESYSYYEKAVVHGNFSALTMIIEQIEGNAGVLNSKQKELFFRYLAIGLDNTEDVEWTKKNRFKVTQLESEFSENGIETIKNDANETLSKIRSAIMSRESAASPKPNEEARMSTGTGFLCSEQGHVLTAAHVIEGKVNIVIRFENKTHEVDIISVDEDNDVALLKVRSRTNFPFLLFAQKRPEQGARVSTYGFPNPDIEGYNDVKFSSGEISSLRGLGDDPKIMRLNLQAAPGNSGGPLLDNDNKVVGVLIQKMNSIKMLKHTGDLATGVAYAIKSDYVTPLLKNNDLQPSEDKSGYGKQISDAVVLIMAK